ncbi:MAG TPA: YciI family protein [Holophaga sp.]|nr:YciI family protein [Holophaga sp.]
MYALAIVRYRKPIEVIDQLLAPHRAYLKSLQEQGLLLASGPLEPRNAGALLLRVDDADPLAALDAIRDGDPFVKAGAAQYELLPWNPVFGKDGLDRL